VPPPTGPATLQVTDLVTGSGQQAAVPMGRSPFAFRLGTNSTIPGYEQGVIGMRVGGTRRIIVPPSLGYGSTGNGTIPGNSWLVFELELLAAA
jgi:FKBP-type peptidyl-prolyl cis-trans isomerase